MNDAEVDRGLTLYSDMAAADTPQDRLARLRRHQNKEAQATRDRLRQLTGIKDDYEQLRGRLETLADKTRHDIMVPFTKVAYFPGTLRHTNEITCLLGDNWFVERSAKQAVEIVDRRLKMCDESIKKVQDGMKLLDNWKEQTEQLRSDLEATRGVNIVEHEVDDSWKDQHRQKVREYKQKVAALREKKTSEQDKPPQEKTFDDIMRMLDERELEEDLKDELSKLGDEDVEVLVEEDETDDEEADTTSDQQTSEEKEETGKKKSVRWSESLDAVKQFRRNELIVDDSIPRIKFSHTKSPQKKQKAARFVDEDPDNDGDGTSAPLPPPPPLVSSPADIFSKFGPGGCVDFAKTLDEPKSILKVKKSTTPVLTDRLQEVVFEEATPDGPENQQRHGQQQQQQQQTPPVGDQVKEREPVNAAEHEQVNTHRPLSRFKASRQHKKL